jgi:TetR/AcrR family transcriptional repressor of mexJK operon
MSLATPAKQSKLRIEKRAQILAAAQALFLTDGYKRTSMDAIRTAAGVSKPTLYTHYADKEALFTDVVRMTFEQIGIERFASSSPDILSIQTKVELRIVLIAFITVILQQMLNSNNVGLLRIAIGEMPNCPTMKNILRQNGPTQGLSIATHFFGLAYQKGIIAVADAELVARLFIGPIASYILTDGLLQSDTPKVPDRARIEELVDLFLKAVC